MKKFLLKTLVLIAPLIVIFIFVELLLQNIPNDYSYKKEYLDKNARNIETLFLGSSHAYHGINPEYISGNSFNASHIAQPIDLDYKLLLKYSQDLKNLKNIVIPISYFSLFGRLSNGTEPWRIKNYTIYYKLNTSNNLRYSFELLSVGSLINAKRIFQYYFNKKNEITCSEFGYASTVKNNDLIKTGKAASKQHTIKDKKYLQESIEIISKIISYGKKNNINVLFYTSPAYYSYRENLDSNQYNTTIKTMDSICNNHKNSYYLNLISDPNFQAEDFQDADHLNKKGAKKLTIIINEKLAK